MTGLVATDAQIAKLRALASALIPGTGSMPAAADLAGLDALLHVATRTCGLAKQDIELSLGLIGEEIGWTEARALSLEHPGAFGIMSMLVSAAYFMDPLVLEKLGFPASRQNPAEVEDFVEEYESGVMDDVIARDPFFRIVESQQAA